MLGQVWKWIGAHIWVVVVLIVFVSLGYTYHALSDRDLKICGVASTSFEIQRARVIESQGNLVKFKDRLNLQPGDLARFHVIYRNQYEKLSNDKLPDYCRQHDDPTPPFPPLPPG